MTGPTFSPDGQWMWDGNAWIPAPPQANVLPQASLNQTQISTVANNAGVPVNQLSNTAPYFDQNRDGILQNSELQQAAMSIAQSPTVEAPQQPVMQQPAMGQQMAPQQPVMQQPAMTQSQGKIDSAPSLLPGSGPSMKKKIAAGGIVAILLLVVIITYINAQQLAEDESIGLHTISADYTSNDLDSNAIGASDGASDILGAFTHDVDSSGIDWTTFQVGIYVDGDKYDCATEKDEYVSQTAAKCKISWQSTIPSYSP